MFGQVPKSMGVLFSSTDLRDLMSGLLQRLTQEVDQLDANRLLNTTPADLTKYFEEKYRITPIALLEDQWNVDDEEVLVDIRGLPNHFVRDPRKPALVPGERVEVRVPFDGEADLFYARPSTQSGMPPRGTIENGELVLRYDSPSTAPRDLKPEIEKDLGNVRQHLALQAPMIDEHNRNVPIVANRAIEARRARLLAQSQRTAALGIPVRRRDDPPRTYAIPTARKKAAPSLPPASSAPFTPEPTWAMDQYEHALKVIQDMTLVMERSPKSFTTMDEEALRQHFLVQLNGQFEGKATGETFNMEGKTDILLREGERNVFIAECKFWKGPSAFGKALDQLLSYSTWRDSKTAVLVFNRGTSTSTVLDGVDATSKGHRNFKRALDWPHESGFRYVFHSNEDENRELLVTVLVFHVPDVGETPR